MMPIHSIGKTLRPWGDTNVRMVRETVDIMIDNNIAWVGCIFEFLNEGPADTLEVGFPRGYNKEEHYIDQGELYNFSVRNSPPGNLLAITDKRLDGTYPDPSGIMASHWLTCTIPFEGGNPRTVFVEYWTPLNHDKPAFSDLLFKYVLTTGSFWRGPIGEAVVTVRLKNIHPDQLTVIKPAGYTFNGAELSWRFTDFEPAEDIELHIMQDVVYERMKEADRLLREDPGSARGHFLRGTVLFNQSYGGGDESVHEFERALAADPSCCDARWFLAIQNQNQREHMEAIVALNPAYRCTDEAFLSMYPYRRMQFMISAEEWLDMLKSGRSPFETVVPKYFEHMKW